MRCRQLVVLFTTLVVCALCCAAASAEPTPGSTPGVSAVGSIGTGGPVSFLTLGTVAHNAQNTAIAIFQALFGIELIYAGGMWALQTQGSSKLLIDYLIKIIQGMAMMVLIQNAPTALTFTVNAARCLALEASAPNASFSGMCSSGAGLMGKSIASTPAVGTTYAGSIALPTDLTNGLDPGSLLHFGVTTAFSDLMSANLSMSTGGASIASAVLTAAAAATGIGTVLLIVTATAVSVAFLMLAMELLGVTIEAALIGNVGIVMLGFLGSRWTMRYGQNYISYGFSVAARIFIIYMLCGIGEVFFWNEEQTSKAGGWTIASLFMTVATAFIFVFLVKRIDKMTAAIFSGQSSLSGLHDVALPAAETALTAAAIGAAAIGGTAMVAGKMGSISAGSRLAALSGGGGAGGASETIMPPAVSVPPPSASAAARSEGSSSYVPFPGGAAQPRTRAMTPPAETQDAASTNAAPPDDSAASSTPSSPSPSESYETPLAAEGAANRSDRLRQLRASATAQDADEPESPTSSAAIEGEYQPAAAAPQPAPPQMQPPRSMQPTAANRLAQLRRILRQQAAQVGTSAHGPHHIPFDHHK